ncbi:MAG: 2-isopropylmalate synthase [Vampirovibrionales bacterium]|nr:2-isopropylmalate synthase [Vampirovibrionales bacterium]
MASTSTHHFQGTPDNQVQIFDTTLRDGEQSAGASLKPSEKILIARQLALLNVDVMEAGFPASSAGDFDSVQQIAREVGGQDNAPRITGLCRTIERDIDAAWDAVKVAKKARIHTFVATSDIHIAAKFKKTRDEVLTLARDMVAYAKAKTVGHGDADIEFSAEDAGRTDPYYLYKVLEAVIDAGARVVNIPDTVGYTIPDEFGRLIKGIVNNVPNIDQAIISTHCHNDLGLATANSLAGAQNGARQIECTINGIGERAGNAAMEEVVMAMKVRREYLGNLWTQIHTEAFYETSQMVSDLTSMTVQHNKAVVGSNAFAHESGIHQDGFLKGRDTYEIMKPEWIGLNGSKLPLGPRSGRAAVRSRLLQLGVTPNDDGMVAFFEAFKTLADHQKRIEDEDLKKLLVQVGL